MRVIHKKFTYEYKILLVETKFNLCVICVNSIPLKYTFARFYRFQQ